jgi:hypothetical protein
MRIGYVANPFDISAFAWDSKLDRIKCTPVETVNSIQRQIAARIWEVSVKNQGSLVVIVIFAVATGAALFAWNFRMQQSHLVLELYGGQFAALIRGAETVQWLDIVPSDGPAGRRSDTDDGSAASPNLSADPIDITQQSGLIHARAALISDVSYQWDAPIPPARWQFALRFKDSDLQCTLAFDLDSQQCICLENDKRIVLGEKLVTGLKAFVDEVRR